jgi:hypothetical protein
LADDSEKAGIYVFNLPPDFEQGTHVAKAILQFRIHPVEDCNIWIHVNDATLDLRQSNAEALFTMRKGDHRLLHEVIHGELFRPGQQNKITIMGTPAPPHGDFFIADVVLWFQRRIKVG